MYALKKLKHDFLAYLEAERGRSQKTIENYDRYLGRFFFFGKIKKPADITVELVEAYRQSLSASLDTKGSDARSYLDLRTQNYHLTALRSFLKYLRLRSLPVLSPERITLATVPRRSPERISPAELERLMRAPDQRTLEGKRDRAIIMLLSATGLRVSELCALSLSDVGTSCDEVSVRRKGDKVRVVFLSDTARTALQEYLKNRKDMDDAMFIRYGRKQNDGGDLRISPRAVQRLIKQYAVAAGITTPVTPQTLRHQFAHDLIAAGTSLQEVQVQLGFVSETVLRSYLATIRSSEVEHD